MKRRRVEVGICTVASLASAINARTLATPAAAITASVAVLSLWAIMASSTLRVRVRPARTNGSSVDWSPNTELPSERIVSSIVSCFLSAPARSFSTPRRYCARMKVLIALPTNRTAFSLWPWNQPPLGAAAATAQLAFVTLSWEKRLIAATTAGGLLARAGTLCACVADASAGAARPDKASAATLRR
jgi:hypothetical protein